MKIKHLLLIILGVSLFFACDKTSDSLHITYPETGQYGQNVLADGVVTVKQTGDSRYEYSVKAELPAGASSLKIIIKNEKEGDEYVWGGNDQGSEENWLISSWNNNLKGNTWNVIENGKSADALVIFFSDCIIEYYENGATEPTKVKEIKVIP